MKPGPRERLIDAAIRLVQERGVQGTGISDLLDRSSTARQSIYQHFPGGKDELIAAATQVAGDRILAEIAAAAERGGPREAVSAALSRWEKTLSEHDFRLGCPIAAATVDGTTEPIRTAALAAFESWTATYTAVLEHSGIATAAARSLAGFVVTAIEGAVLHARATRSVHPLHDCRDQLDLLLVAQLTGVAQEDSPSAGQ
ncbi:TetR/AcrR family transcriptional regulator [Nocardia iowensis]|uniref:TetR/AcrR family transcriptional regulator n=1 Tax=Nocardia iowensis TaxID=204891 RepID=A0ABX8RTQ1_NOCIO|nr:TetR/AcrR family transcriptional regulator [Nocardia iowensis]QXN92968.1 TetR/AcrR family transcriptional regulator [Nocardia iowensis]